MKALLVGLGATICLGVATSAALADPPPYAGMPPLSPYTYGPGCNYPNPMGGAYGPNNCQPPCFAPFSGVLPPPMPPMTGNCGGQRKGLCGLFKRAGGPGMGPGGPCAGAPAGPPQTTAAFASHPYVRGPRDYFMQD